MKEVYSSLLTLYHNRIILLYRDTVLTLRPGESSLRFVVGIFDDVVPEIDENFDLRLASPSGGVTLGPRQSVSVTVLNNDNAHGLIGFAEVHTCINEIIIIVITCTTAREVVAM
jgi:hypothetical protein